MRGNEGAGASGEVTFKDLGPEDLDLLMNWRETVLREVFEVDPQASIKATMAENRRYYEQHLADGSHVAVLALLGGEAASCGGICLYDEMPSPDNPSGRCAYLMNIYTKPEFRGRGVGPAIVRRLVDEARTRGAEKIYLETTERARGMYTRLGFEPMKGFLQLGDKGSAS